MVKHRDGIRCILVCIVSIDLDRLFTGITFTQFFFINKNTVCYCRYCNGIFTKEFLDLRIILRFTLSLRYKHCIETITCFDNIFHTMKQTKGVITLLLTRQQCILPLNIPTPNLNSRIPYRHVSFRYSTMFTVHYNSYQ